MNFPENQDLKVLLEDKKQILVIPHINPDGDAMGSCLAWCKFLQKLGHNAKVLCPNDYPDFLRWMPGQDNVLVFSEETNSQVRQEINDAEVIFCLDFNGLKRIGPLGEMVGESKAKKVVIDHHLFPDDFADITFSYTNMCSTCQLIYLIIEDLGMLNQFDSEMGECIYTGIITDTGSFKYRATDSDTHRISSEIMKLGVDTEMIHREIYDTSSESRLRLLGHLLVNSMVVIPEKKTAYFTLSAEEMDQFNFQKGDSEGIVNYALSMKGIEIAAFFREAEENIRISFRSKGDTAINKLASIYFSGGGHKNASGGSYEKDLKGAVNKFITVVDEFI